MPATNAWDETKPAGSDLASTIDDQTRQLKLDVRERLADQHVFGTSQADDGNHRNIVIPAAYNAANTEAFISSGGSRTGSDAHSEIEAGSTWNTTGNPVAFLARITNTASGALAALFAGIVDTVSVFYVTLDGIVSAAGLLISGNSDFQSNEVRRPKLTNYTEKAQTPGNITGAVTLDWSAGNHYEATLTGNVTFTFSNIPATGQASAMALVLHQDATGGRTVTWPATVKWASGITPTLSAASKTDLFGLYTVDGGTTIYGSTAGLAF